MDFVSYPARVEGLVNVYKQDLTLNNSEGLIYRISKVGDYRGRHFSFPWISPLYL